MARREKGEWRVRYIDEGKVDEEKKKAPGRPLFALGNDTSPRVFYMRVNKKKNLGWIGESLFFLSWRRGRANIIFVK